MATNNATNNAGGSSGALTLIQTQTASADVSLVFTTGITGSFNNYLILVSDTTNPDGTAVLLFAQISTDGGATYDSTNYTGVVGVQNGFSIALFNASANAHSASQTTIFNMTSGDGYMNTVSDHSLYDTGTGSSAGETVWDSYTIVATVVNALRIITDDGSTFSGEVSLYGYSL